MQDCPGSVCRDKRHNPCSRKEPIMKLAFVEDDREFAQDLLRTLSSWGWQADYFADFRSFERRCTEYDALILDVDLYGENAIEKLRRLFLPDLAVIFLTSMQVPSTMAVMKSAWGYVIKGSHEETLHQLLTDITRDKSPVSMLRLETLSGSFETDPVRVAGFLNDYTSVFALLPGKNPVRLRYRSLDALEPDLPPFFFRVSRQAILNVRHISDVNRSAHSVLCSGQSFNVSRRRWRPLLETMTRFLADRV